MVAGGTSPAGTMLFTVNSKHALGTGCGMRDRQEDWELQPWGLSPWKSRGKGRLGLEAMKSYGGP